MLCLSNLDGYVPPPGNLAGRIEPDIVTIAGKFFKAGFGRPLRWNVNVVPASRSARRLAKLGQ
jgi:hypothetical protein